MFLEQLLKDCRTNLGISQSSLALESGLSLPLIQKIEAGQGNPSWTTLQQLTQALGLEIQILSKAPPWEALISHGAPLSSMQENHSKIKQSNPTLRSLKKTILLCSKFLLENPETEERYREATQALILALAHGFPHTWEKHFSKTICANLLPHNPSGRQIKLKRIAKDRLSQYL